MDASDPMNADEMLDYTLGQLDTHRREQLERNIVADRALADRLDQLGRRLFDLLDDGDVAEPPPGLARRTVLAVAQRRRRPTYMDLVPVSVPFRWADIAVAASLFIACVFTLVPALKRSNDTWKTVACTNNLHQLGLALNRYATTHQSFPTSEPNSSAPYAGAFALRLNEAGFLPDPGILDCPFNGRNHLSLPGMKSFDQMGATRARQTPCLQNADYAYTLGYEDQNSHHVAIPARLPASYPLVADRPPYTDTVHILDGNSPNHHGAGQNVLCVGGHVGWHSTRQFGPDKDMFLNERHQPAPGVNLMDAVLAPAITRVDGR
jgi:hypothetical protein